MSLIRLPWLSFILVLLAAWAPKLAHAYPNSIGYGYTSCMTCHFNPMGNGILNDYGRALSATTLSARPFFVSAKTTDDDLAEASGFLGPFGTLPDWLRLQFNYRGLYLVENLQDSATTRYISMQTDGSIVLKTADDRFFFSGRFGYEEQPAGSTRSSFISREHYVGYLLSKELGIYAGLMDIAYGIRIPDHITFSRVVPGVAQDDQVHGALLHFFLGKKWEGALQGFLGKLTDDSTTQRRGGSFTLEYSVAERARVGGSAMLTTSDVANRSAFELHTRLGFAEGDSLLAETGVVHDSFPASPDSGLTRQYVFVQPTYRLIRGLNLLLTGEYYSPQIFEDAAQTIRIAPAIQYLPFQRLELRVDLSVARNFGGGIPPSTDAQLINQFLVWL